MIKVCSSYKTTDIIRQKIKRHIQEYDHHQKQRILVLLPLQSFSHMVFRKPFLLLDFPSFIKFCADQFPEVSGYIKGGVGTLLFYP